MGNACEKCEHPNSGKEKLKSGDEEPAEKGVNLAPEPESRP